MANEIEYEFEYLEHKVQIDRRKSDKEPYNISIYYPKGGSRHGSTYPHKFTEIEPVIKYAKEEIDNYIIISKKVEEEFAERRKLWKGRKFKRGDFVHFKGDDKYKAQDTYVWTWFGHLSLAYYIIEHTDGIDRSHFLAGPGWRDGFESVHSSQLKEGLKYIQVECSGYFPDETDQLELIKEAE